MSTLTRSAAPAPLAVWIVLAVALWNGMFEMMVVRGVKEYLFAAELSTPGAGRSSRSPR